jgi:hypothetical protein
VAKSNLIPGKGGGDDGIEPRALASGWRTRNPPAKVIQPHREAIERDVLLVDQLEDAAALDRLIVTRITEFLEDRGWDQKGNGRQGRRMRVEVEHLGRAVDRLARRAEQLRRARLDAAVAGREGLLDLASYYAQPAEEEEDEAERALEEVSALDVPKGPERDRGSHHERSDLALPTVEAEYGDDEGELNDEGVCDGNDGVSRPLGGRHFPDRTASDPHGAEDG